MRQDPSFGSSTYERGRPSVSASSQRLALALEGHDRLAGAVAPGGNTFSFARGAGARAGSSHSSRAPSSHTAQFRR